jgi:predicted transcriptional regulator
MAGVPELSRFELQCLGKLWSRGSASIREVHEALEDPPSYSTVKKIFERLEEKSAVARVRREGKAWVYRSTVKPRAMIRKEVRRLLDALFDGEAVPLVAHLADTDELSLDDLREIERTLKQDARSRRKQAATRREPAGGK